MSKKYYNVGMIGGLHMAGNAECYKDDQIIKRYSYVISVKADKKYGYFIISQKIYRHEIMSTIRYRDCDRIIYTDSKGVRKEIRQDD